MADVTLKTTFVLRRGTAAEWVQANPILAAGEPGFETDTGILKVGDGTTRYINLPCINTESAVISGDNITITMDNYVLKLKGFADAQALSGIRKTANGGIEWVKLLSEGEITTELNSIKADITTLNTNKLNVLPKVDDPTDPGFGWEYHIPYNFDAVPDTEKLNITLKTLTLDNKVTKMNFEKTLPSATTSTAGLMSAADKVALGNKQDKLTAGTNITIDENNVISATGGGASYQAGNGISIDRNTISTKLGNGLKHTESGNITLQTADRSISVGEFGIHVPVISTSLDVTDNGLAVKIADDSIVAYNSGTGTKGIKVNTGKIQSKLTAGSNIIIDSNNVISATGGSSTLQSELTTNITVGGISAGTTFAAGTSLESILRQMLYSAPVTDTKLYYGVASAIPASVSGMSSISTTKSELLASGYTYKNVTTNNEYVMVAVDKTLGVSCYEFTESGFSLGFVTKDLGNQILYYLDSPTTGTGARYVLHFEEA